MLLVRYIAFSPGCRLPAIDFRPEAFMLKLIRRLRVMIDIGGSLSYFCISLIGSAARHVFDMVWLYHSPIPVGRRGVFSLFK